MTTEPDNQTPPPRIVTAVREHPNRTLAIFLTALVVIAGIGLPEPLFWAFLGVLVLGGALVCAAYWYEQAIRVESENVGLRIDNIDLARRLNTFIARHAEVLDEVVLLRDELETTPIPFEIVGHNVIPLQRVAGSDS